MYNTSLVYIQYRKICECNFFSYDTQEFPLTMPNRRRNEIKPDLKPALKGVVEIVVPKKAPEVSTPVYKYFKDNADYSEKKCTSTEDTRSFRLQIEQHLNEVSQLHER